MDSGKGCSGFVLAGGRSRRMGTNKALLPLSGRRLVDHAVDLLVPHVEEAFVVGPPEVFPFLHVPVRPDEIRQGGPLGGLLTGLRRARFEKSLVLGVDLPFLNGEILERILRESGDADATVPKIGDTAETLCAVYSRRCINVIEGLLLSGHKSVVELLGRVRTRFLDEECFREMGAPQAFFNINTREDYEEAKRRAAHLHPAGAPHA